MVHRVCWVYWVYRVFRVQIVSGLRLFGGCFWLPIWGCFDLEVADDCFQAHAPTLQPSTPKP